MKLFRFVTLEITGIRNIALWMLLLSFTGCSVWQLLSSVIEKPTFRYDSYRLLEPNLKHVTAELHLVANNPNSIGMKDVLLNYKVFTDGKKIIEGENIEITLAPNGDTKINVPVKITYSDAIAASGSILQRIIKGDKEIPLEVSVRVFGTPTLMTTKISTALFSLDYSTKQEIKIPIPKEELEKLKPRALEDLKRLF